VKDVKIAVMAVLNDSTGTLMSCAHKNLNCRIGVIIGKKLVHCNVFKFNAISENLKMNQSMNFCLSFWPRDYRQ
jgi:hexokinase